MSLKRVGFCGLFALSAALVAEQGKLVLHVASAAGNDVADVAMAVSGAGGGPQRTDSQSGRVVLTLAPETKANSLVSIHIAASPKGHDYVMVSPWDGYARVPSFENDSANLVEVVVVEKGEKASLQYGKVIASLTAKIVQANAPKTVSKEGAPDTSKENLEAISKQYGLAPEEVDKAIREWGKKATDPYDIGLAALYARNYPEATKQLTASLEMREEALRRDRKKDEDAVVDAASSLGESLFGQGRFKDASIAQDQALQLRPDDPALVGDKARSLYQAGDYVGAERLFRVALAIFEKAQGPEHPNTLASLNNLALLLTQKGDYAEAESLLRRALIIDQKSFHLEHPETGAILNNLAQVLVSKGDYLQAESLYRQSLAICERLLGADHPDTASSLANLAEVLADRGNFTEAELLYRRALSIREKTLGLKHPYTAKTLNGLAEVLYTRGDYADAEPLIRRALSIQEETLGSDHLGTAGSLTNLGNLLRLQCDYAGAEFLHRRALAIVERVLGRSTRIQQQA